MTQIENEYGSYGNDKDYMRWSRDALLRVGFDTLLFVAEGSGAGVVARQKPVTVGELTNGAYVVQSGLKAGDRVIVSNLQKIGDGAPVKPS